MKKIVSAAMAAVMAMSAVSALSMGVSADWENTDSGKVYVDSATKEKYTYWKNIDGSRYFFGSDGIMRTGLRKINGKIYYFGKDGKMRTGKVKINGKIYNFGKNGALIESADTVKKDNMSAADVLTLLKNELDGSYGCDNVVSEKEAVEYFGLDSSKIDSIVYENNSINAINMDTALIIKVKDGYADEAAKLLQESFDQWGAYSRTGHYDEYKTEQARLFVNGNYVALLVLGANDPDENADEKAERTFAASEAEKVDKAWEKIFGTNPENIVKIPDAFELEEGMVL